MLELAVKKAGPDKFFHSLTPEQREILIYQWRILARPEQLAPPQPWLVWLVLAGRGFGKTRTGAEWVRGEIESNRRGRLALVAPTAADARDVIVEGSSGIMATSPPWFKPVYEPSKRRLTWPNGAIATCYSAEEPDRLRGPQHDGALCDELAAWQYAQEAWDNLMFGLRLGPHPCVVVTTTPRPIRLLRALKKAKDTVLTQGSTFDNAKNLPPSMLEMLKDKYEGTRLGRQEIYAELLDDVEGALWTHGMIDKARVAKPVTLKRVVVAVDPSGSAKRTADEAGIVVVGIGDCNCMGKTAEHAFVLEDLTGRYSPRDMGIKAIGAYYKWSADRLVAEDNFGGQIIRDLIELIDNKVAYKSVHASRGKIVRAEPVSALYEQGRVHHIGIHKEMEEEMTTYAPLVSTESPGRLDALVWAVTELMLSNPVTLGEGDIVAGVRRGDEKPTDIEDDEERMQWRR